MSSKNKNNFNLLKRLYAFLKPYKRKFWISVCLSIVLALLAPIRPYLIQYTIDKVIVNKFVDMLIYISIIQVGILLLESFIRFVFMYLTTWTSQHVVDDMRRAVFKKLVYQSLRYFDNTPVGTLTTRTVNDIESVNEVFSDGIVSIAADILTIIVIIVIMWMTDWQLTLVSLAVFPLLIVATYFFKEAVKKSFQTVRTAVSNLNAFVQEHLSGMYVVQAFGAEKTEQAKFTAINKIHKDANIKAIFAYSVFFPIVEIILAVSTGLLVWYGASQMMDKEISQGVIIAFIMYLNLLFRPLRMLADKFNTLQMGLVAGERVLNVLHEPDNTMNNGQIVSAAIQGDVKLENVYFEYKEGIPVLNGISFHVKPGKTLAIIGHTGAGKTSIISILTRLYEIKSGDILIDDINVKDYDIYKLRKQVGIVLQDVFLFSGTILDNITMENPEMKKEDVVAVCQLLGVHDFIMQLPGNYDFNIRERGSTLSQGQRQLLSFARALIYDPKILILDEATSSVDTESEILVQEAIGKLIKGRTSIVIAHRLSTIRKADEIIVLEKGSIVEQGNHKNLIALQGMYANMYLTAQSKANQPQF